MGSFLFSQEIGPKPRARVSPESATEWKSASLDFTGTKSGCLVGGEMRYSMQKKTVASEGTRPEELGQPPGGCFCHWLW